MKQFFKILFGSCLGTILALVIVILFFASFGIGKSSKKAPKVSANSILHLNIEGEVTDRTYENPFSNYNAMGFFSVGPNTTGLFDIIKALESAKTDKNIKAVLLEVDAMSIGYSSLNQLMKALEDFKKSNKLVYLYSDLPTQKIFLLASVADKAVINPIAHCEFDGLAMENMYYTGLFEKAGVEPMIFYAGEFKSATEPYRLKQMSDKNKLQLTELLNDLYDSYLTNLSNKRKIDKATLKTLADNLSVTLAEDALKYGLVDALQYRDDFYNDIKKKMGYKASEKVNLVSYNQYHKINSLNVSSAASNNQQIAVVFAEGTILDGEQEQGSVGSTTYLKLLTDIQDKVRDKKIKALVLRVNSPGGSAYASEQIWHKLLEIKKDIPIVVSFGDVAASGGYYIACASDKIFAETNTITGSIGAYAMLFNTEDLLNKKLGITTDAVKTNTYSDYISFTRDWSEKEKQTMQRSIDVLYTRFKKRVADCRKLDSTIVSNIAKGRVYSGVDAKTIGLVDAIGSLEDAINEAKKLAKIENYTVQFYPEDKAPFDFFLSTFMKDEDKEDNIMINKLSKTFPAIKDIYTLKDLQTPQYRLPYSLNVKY